MISVIIPAIDEKTFIRKTLKSALAGKNVEVIVADGGSIDGTRELSASLGARVVPTCKGRAAQMNEGVGHALGDILLFVHADSVLPRGYDDAIRSALADSDVAAGAFSLSFHEGDFVMDLIAFGANLRSRYLKLPYGDQGFFVRKGTFHNAGGFPEVPIMEDVAFIRAMHETGRVVTLKSKVTTSSRRFQAISPFRALVLNQLAMVGFFLGMPIDDLAVLYRSRERSIGIWMKQLIIAAKKRITRRA
jgi:rSAM/selenodomain-associated transferase 2